MAAKCHNEPEKMAEWQRCSKCTETDRKPRIFPCEHSFCNRCFDEIPYSSEEDGRTCPECHVFARETDITGASIVDSIQSIQLKLLCNLCVKAPIIECCVQCNIGLCQPCTERHKRTSFSKFHQYVQPNELDDRRSMLEFCDTHPEHVISSYCTQCEISICLQCNAETHDGHPKQTIEQTLDQMLPEVKRNIGIIKVRTSILNGKQHHLINEKERLRMEYDKCKASYRHEYDKIVNEARKQLERDLADLDQSFKINLELISMELQDIKVQIESNIDKTRTAEEKLSNCSGATLVKKLNDGLQELLNLESKLKVNTLCIDVEVPNIENMLVQKDNLLGMTMYSTRNIADKISSRHYQISVCKVLKKLSGKEKIAAFKKSEFRMNEVDGEIWICSNDDDSSEIIAYNQSGKVVKKIKCEKIIIPRSLKKVKDHVIVAGNNGLHLITTTGEYLYSIAEGFYTDISSYVNNTVAAVDSKLCKVVIVVNVDNYWNVQHKITMHDRDETIKTIHLASDVVYVSYIMKQKIYKYNIQGELLAEYGSQGTFYHPFITGTDATTGDLIVCDYGNHRLQILNAETEQWTPVPLQEGWMDMVTRTWATRNTNRSITNPVDLLYIDGSLFILWAEKKIRHLSKLICE